MGTKKCSRCGAAAYCSAECQRKAWPEHKVSCQRVDSVENDVRELLKAGKVYSARERVRQLPSPNKKLDAELEEQFSLGIHSEIIDGAIRVESVGDMGRGYVAARDLQPGEPLLFDTAFLAVPVDGPKAMHERMQEKLAKRLTGEARRRSAKIDAQADFFYSVVKDLPLKGNMERGVFNCNSITEEQQEQLMVFSICEGCAMPCTEEPFMALYPAACYFNHSCAPNASTESSRSTLLVRAAQPIAAGEEVFVSYLPTALLDRPLAERRDRLQGGRGFECRCRRCLAGPGEGEGAAAATEEDAPPAFERLPKLGSLGAAAAGPKLMTA